MNTLETFLHGALERRRHLFAVHECFRLFDGTGDGHDGIFVDRYGPVVLVHLLEDGDFGDAAIRDVGWDRFRAAACAAAVYLRRHRQDPRRSAERNAELLAGERTERAVVTEWGARYEIAPEAQVNAGLFLDMREVRRKLAETSAGRSVLNLFCFTGSLGISCLLGGAREVAQVDVSKGALRWAKRNGELNQENFSGTHRLIAEDAVTYVERAKRRRDRAGTGYDLVIVDPPSVGRSERGTFSLARDLSGLIASALELLQPGGELYLSCNYTGLAASALEALCRHAADRAGAAVRNLSALSPPSEDFTATPEKSRSMRGVYLRLGSGPR